MPKQKKPSLGTSDLNLTGLANPEVFETTDEPVSDDIITWIENSYDYWQQHNDRWRTVTLESEAAVEAVVEDARRYCTKLRDVPLTFQVKNGKSTGGTLVYRVRESIRRS